MQDMNQTCLECGHSFGLHSTDGARCPKNGGFPINEKLEWFATHFEGGLSEDEKRIAELTAANESMMEDAVQNTYALSLFKELNEKQAAEIDAIKAAIEDIKYYVGNPLAWEHYDDGVSEKIRAILKAAGMA